MKLGIIADIHSNVIALKAVLEEFEKRNVEKIICCGDIIGIGPHPEETVQELRKRKNNFISVRGNHEQYLIKGLPKKVHDDKRAMSIEEIQNHTWNHTQLSDVSKEFIRKLPMSETLVVENKTIYIVHYPMNESEEYKKHIKLPTFEENKEMFSDVDGDIFLYGHTHIASVNHDESKWYINPGSLGCPMKSDYANCGILVIEKEKVEFESINIRYNAEEVIQEIERIQFPMYERILDIFYGRKT